VARRRYSGVLHPPRGTLTHYRPQNLCLCTSVCAIRVAVSVLVATGTRGGHIHKYGGPCKKHRVGRLATCGACSQQESGRGGRWRLQF